MNKRNVDDFENLKFVRFKFRYSNLTLRLYRRHTGNFVVEISEINPREKYVMTSHQFNIPDDAIEYYENFLMANITNKVSEVNFD